MPDPPYFSPEGEPIGLEAWMAYLHDPAHHDVAKTVVGRYLVSTVYLGLNHGCPGGPLEIFETMVFVSEGPAWAIGEEVECWRWSTRIQALAGHDQIVASWQAVSSDDPPI